MFIHLLVDTTKSIVNHTTLKESQGVSHSVVSDSLVTLWTVACQDPLFMGFFRQEYWRGLPFPSPGDLPDLGIKPMSPVSPALQETQIWYLSWEDLMEKGMETQSGILAWEIPRIEEPGGLRSMGSQRVIHN